MDKGSSIERGYQKSLAGVVVTALGTAAGLASLLFPGTVGVAGFAVAVPLLAKGFALLGERAVLYATPVALAGAGGTGW